VAKFLKKFILGYTFIKNLDLLKLSVLLVVQQDCNARNGDTKECDSQTETDTQCSGHSMVPYQLMSDTRQFQSFVSFSPLIFLIPSFSLCFSHCKKKLGFSLKRYFHQPLRLMHFLVTKQVRRDELTY
jgi:hypothetical protein